MEEAVKKSLKTDEITDKYVWYTCYKSEDVKNVAQAQEIYNLLVNEQKRINTAGALNNEKVTNKTEGNTTLKVSAGNKFELGLKTFTKAPASTRPSTLSLSSPARLFILSLETEVKG